MKKRGKEMNVLILTARFGMGHISAAEAIKEEIISYNNNDKIYIVDVMDFLFPSLSKTIYSGFNNLTSKFASLYNLLNKTAGNHNSSVPLKKVLVKKVDDLLDRYETDFIISTIPIASKYISMYKETKKSNIPLYTYITDITAHNEWLGKETDMYFVGSKETKDELIKKGVEEDKIQICGIPVRQAFKNIKHIKEKQKKEILIMGGGLGLIPGIENILYKLNKNEKINLTLICGKNRELYQKIKTKFPSVNAVGYTNKVHEYMMKADLIITKSGGITTFEAIHTSCPLYIIEPFLMQEVGNAEYIEKNNIGKIKWDKKSDLADEVINLIEDEQELNKMKENMDRIRKEIKSDYLLSILSA